MLVTAEKKGRVVGEGAGQCLQGHCWEDDIPLLIIEHPVEMDESWAGSAVAPGQV